jgi:hypothetical protein
MIRKLQIQEMATEKILDLEPVSIGTLLVLRNIALKETIHIDLDVDDMKAIVALLQNRIEEIEILEKEQRAQEVNEC